MADSLLTLDHALMAYRQGWFPMAHSAHDAAAQWCRPRQRGLLPLDDRFHLPRRLARIITRQAMTVTADQAFNQVINECARATPTRPDTWINQEICDLFTNLAKAGHAHSLEVWQDQTLIGGLYGLHLGGVFFAESMFTRRPNASSVALVALVALCRRQGFSLLDTQFINDHLARFGAYELADVTFTRQLRQAVTLPVTFDRHGVTEAVQAMARGLTSPRR